VRLVWILNQEIEEQQLAVGLLVLGVCAPQARSALGADPQDKANLSE